MMVYQLNFVRNLDFSYKNIISGRFVLHPGIEKYTYVRFVAWKENQS